MIKVWSKSISVWLAVMCICFRAFSFNTSDELVRAANLLLGEYKEYEALQKFEEVLIHEPTHYEALYKTSLLHSRIGSRYADEMQKSEHFVLAKTYAEKALQENRLGADANYVMALALSNLSFVSGAKARIAYLKEIRSHIDVALAANANYAPAWQLLGRWHYKVANFNIIECTISKVLNGCAKEEASNTAAVSCMQKAIALDPANINYYHDLAVIYKDMKAKDQSLTILQQAISLQPITAEDLELSRRCKALLSEMNPS